MSNALTTVLQMIRDGELDGDERVLYDAIKQRRNVRDRMLKHSFIIGETVTFAGGGRKIPAGTKGVIVDKKVKNVHVEIEDTPTTRVYGIAGVVFVCPPSILKKAA